MRLNEVVTLIVFGLFEVEGLCVFCSFLELVCGIHLRGFIPYSFTSRYPHFRMYLYRVPLNSYYPYVPGMID